MWLRRFKPSKAHLRVATLAILIVMCTLVLLSAVFPFPEGTWDFLSIGTSQKASANPDWLSGYDYRKEITINGTTAGNQTNYQMRIDVAYNRSISVAQPHMTKYGTVLEQGEATEWDDEGIGVGPVVDVSGTLKMLYGGYGSVASPSPWRIGLATSTDGGETWAKQGKKIDPETGFDMVYPGDVYYDGETYTLFAFSHKVADGSWDIIYYTSSNYTSWTYGGWVTDNTALSLSGPLTNPSIIKVGSYYYLAVSYDTNKGIRLLKSSSLTSGYADLEYIIEAANATSPYYAGKAIDSKIFLYGGQYVITFVGAVSGGDLDQPMFAYNNADIEDSADWYVVYNPWYFSTNTLGGRFGYYVDGDTLKIWLDKTEGDNEVWYFYLEPYRVLTLEEHCETDFDDVRFTASDGATQLDHWLENKVDGDYATFWVEVDSIVASPSTTGTYIYYGKVGDTSASDGNATFVANTFDHFLGSSLNTTKWYEWLSNGSYGVSGSILTVTGGASAWEGIGGKNQVGSGHAFRVKAKYDEQARSQIGADERSDDGSSSGGTDAAYFRYISSKDYTTTDDGDAETTARTSILSGYVPLEIQWQSDEANFLEGDVLRATHDTEIPIDNMGLSFTTYGVTTDALIDWACIRKCADPEPLWCAWGEEEPLSAEITNTPSSNNFGILQVNTTGNTAINYFTIENTGNCAVDVVIYGTDLAGGDDTWDLADTGTPGENIYGLYAGLDDADDLFDVIVRETETYNTLLTDLAEDATQDWGLKIYMPTSVTDYDAQEMSGTITLVASESS